MVSINEYRKSDPYTETILTGKSGDLFIVNRYGPDSYSVWRTNADHLYDETYGSSVCGTLEDILTELKNEI